MTIIIGVDPGGRSTGVIVRERDDLLYARVVVRRGDDKLPGHEYLGDVHAAIDDQMIVHNDEVVLAVEGLRHPNPHEGVINVYGLIGTGMVLAVVVASWPDAIVVPPNKHGALVDGAYPPGIRSGVRIGGETVHARSAWDVAAAGRFRARTRNATNITRPRSAR